MQSKMFYKTAKKVHIQFKFRAPLLTLIRENSKTLVVSLCEFFTHYVYIW